MRGVVMRRIGRRVTVVRWRTARLFEARIVFNAPKKTCGRISVCALNILTRISV